jgi:hypothetical protein
VLDVVIWPDEFVITEFVVDNFSVVSLLDIMETVDVFCEVTVDADEDDWAEVRSILFDLLKIVSKNTF